MLRLAHRGLVLLEPGLLPAFVPDAWEELAPVAGQRLVRAGGFLLAPTEQPGAAVHALAAQGASALVLVGTCASPGRALEPGDVLVVERARDALGQVEASAPLAMKFARRCEAAGLRAARGTVRSGEPARQEDLGEDAVAAGVLRAAQKVGLAAAALLVCTGPDPGMTEAPAAFLESLDALFDVVEGVLGKPEAAA